MLRELSLKVEKLEDESLEMQPNQFYLHGVGSCETEVIPIRFFENNRKDYVICFYPMEPTFKKERTPVFCTLHSELQAEYCT